LYRDAFECELLSHDLDIAHRRPVEHRGGDRSRLYGVPALA